MEIWAASSHRFVFTDFSPKREPAIPEISCGKPFPVSQIFIPIPTIAA